MGQKYPCETHNSWDSYCSQSDVRLGDVGRCGLITQITCGRFREGRRSCVTAAGAGNWKSLCLREYLFPSSARYIPPFSKSSFFSFLRLSLHTAPWLPQDKRWSVLALMSQEIIRRSTSAPQSPGGHQLIMREGEERAWIFLLLKSDLSIRKAQPQLHWKQKFCPCVDLIYWKMAALLSNVFRWELQRWPLSRWA